MQSMMLVAGAMVGLWMAQAPAIESKPFHAWAPTPPMGWNSWDCFGATVTEEQTKANADYMAERLASHGWKYVVVDIQWYEPQSNGWNYDRNPKPVIDEYGRLWPVVAKFPSSADGKGFQAAGGLRACQGAQVRRAPDAGDSARGGQTGLPSPWDRCYGFELSRIRVASARGTRTCTASICPSPGPRRTMTPSSSCSPSGRSITSRWMICRGRTTSIRPRSRRFARPSTAAAGPSC